MSWISTTIIFEKKEAEKAFPTKIPLTIEEVFEENFMVFIPQIREVNSSKEAQFKRRFQKGDRCFVAFDEDKTATHFSWVRTKGLMGISSAKRYFPVTSNTRWIFDCRTNPLFKGKGIYPHVISHLCNELLREENVNTIKIDTTTDNIPSMKGIEKAGFKRHLVIYKVLYFSFVRKIDS